MSSTFSQALRLARRDMRGSFGGFRIFLACLILGVGAIAAVGNVREGLRAGLESQGAVLLGGDASVSFTYRSATNEELSQIQTFATEVSEIADFRSMLVLNDERALTQVKAVDSAYPLYGDVVLDPAINLDEALAGDANLPGIVLDGLLIDRLNVPIGGEIKLGDTPFVVTARVISVPDNANAGFGLGPVSIVKKSALQGSGFLSEGTLFNSHYKMRVAEGKLDAARTALTASLEAKGARWQDSTDGAPGLRRFVDRLSAFLVLVGLAGLAVGGVGISAAVRSYLDKKTTIIAILRALGASRRLIFSIYFIQIGALSVIGILIGLIAGALVPIALAPVLSGALPVSIDLMFHPKALMEAALYGSLAALLFTIWPLSRSENVKAADLFRDAALGTTRLPRWRYILVCGGILLTLIAAAAYLSGMVSLALWSFFGLAAAFLSLVAAGYLIKRLSRWLGHRKLLRGMPTVRMALSAVGGPGGEASAVVLSLGLGLSVLAAVGQIDNNLRGAISEQLPDVAPSFFVLDIQPDQISPFLERLERDPEVSRIQTAPMLRGTLTNINGKPASEVAPEHWVVRGDRGLTYAHVPGENAVVAGEWWAQDYDGPPQISFAAEEAEEIGLKLGDELTVNVLGRDISATITSFREVSFRQAGMGFVIVFNPAALQGAPHSFIATIYANQQAEASILRDVGNAFPNVTLISIRDTISRVSGLMEQIAQAITYGALATLLTGFVVLLGAAAAGERARIYEAAILKSLGATRREILVNFAIRSGVLGLAAGSVAVIAGGAAGFGVIQFVMEQDYQFDLTSALSIVFGGIFATVIVGIFFALRPLSMRPASILRARE